MAERRCKYFSLIAEKKIDFRVVALTVKDIVHYLEEGGNSSPSCNHDEVIVLFLLFLQLEQNLPVTEIVELADWPGYFNRIARLQY